MSALIFLAMLGFAFLYPLLGKRRRDVNVQVHPECRPELPQLTAPQYKRIAIALEFSRKDDILLSHALGQASKGASFILVHIVESASQEYWEMNQTIWKPEKTRSILIFMFSG